MEQTQIKILEKARHDMKLSITDFCMEIGISRQWYYTRLANFQDAIDLKTLSTLAMDRVGTPIGKMAVECIMLIDQRFVPCPCNTEHGDNGPCPRGHVRKTVPAASYELEAV